MTLMYRSDALENKELLALYGGERDPYSVRDDDCTSEEYEMDSECSEEWRGGRDTHSSLSLEIYGLQKEGRERHVYFTNQEYYWRLEELKRAHLRNMAQLERMYISQDKDSQDEEDDGGLGGGKNGEPISLAGEGAGCRSARRLQRINSQEELDFHETSSGSDQSEPCREDSLEELELDHPIRTAGRDTTFGREMLLNPEGMTAQKRFRFQPKASCPKPQGKLSRHTGVGVRSNSRITVPKPFQMMLREEERKRHQVQTRSEVELENTLLRRELEELRECRKKFRASPAPAHIHLPLYEVIGRRSGQRPGVSRGKHGGGNNGNQALSAASQRPFSFLERERRKKEAKIVAELGSLGPKEERQVFKARPMPSSVYGPRRRSHTGIESHQAQSLILSSLEREATEGQGDTSLRLEPDRFLSKLDTAAYDGGSWRSQRHPSAKPVKKQIELSIQMVKEREWLYIDPLKTACDVFPSLQPGSQEPLLAHKSDYISV